jgi:RimJ/RimL family protein N-acetyltransferase
VNPDNLTIRPITGREELDLFRRLPYLLNDELDGDLKEGRRRPEWMWLALLDDRPLARLAWWSRPTNAVPDLMDILDVDDSLPASDRVEIGVRLLRTALSATLPEGTTPPEYGRYIPPDWRDHADARAVVEDRMAIAERTGAQLFVERLRLEWRPGTAIPEPSGRLEFRPPHDRAELLALMTEVLQGTLDAHSRHDLTRMSAEAAAVRHYEDELARYSSPRDWWRVALLPDGQPVGFVLPAHNGYNPIIAYLAVLPRQRGNGYIDDILAEGTRILAGQDVPRIRASTDLGNVPMARAFERCGYVNFGREINMTWS